jgi:hypothetical protein
MKWTMRSWRPLTVLTLGMVLGFAACYLLVKSPNEILAQGNAQAVDDTKYFTDLVGPTGSISGVYFSNAELRENKTSVSGYRIEKVVKMGGKTFFALKNGSGAQLIIDASQVVAIKP